MRERHWATPAEERRRGSTGSDLSATSRHVIKDHTHAIITEFLICDLPYLRSTRLPEAMMAETK